MAFHSLPAGCLIALLLLAPGCNRDATVGDDPGVPVDTGEPVADRAALGDPVGQGGDAIGDPVGHGDDDDQLEASVSPSDTASPRDTPPREAGGGEEKPVLESAAWEEVMERVRQAGRPVVLDIWSLACEPCMTEFPGLIALARDHGDSLQCISANIDYDGRASRPAESYRPAVQEFLDSQQPGGEHFLCTTANEEVYTALGIDSIPAVLVFDAQGELVKQFVDVGETAGFTYVKDVAPFVDEMLAGGN